MAENDGVWRTINGRAVHIKEGESIKDAMDRAGINKAHDMSDAKRGTEKPTGKVKTQEEWESSVSDKEKDALDKWSGEDTFEKLREHMAGNHNAEAQETLDTLDRVLDKAPRFEGQVFRGMAVTPDDLASLKPGGTLELKAHSSFSQHEKVASTFTTATSKTSGAERVILRAMMKKSGVDVSKFMYDPDEREVLGLKGSTYRIKKTERGTSGRHAVTYVDLEEV